MDIISVLSKYYKGQEWTLNGDGYEGLIWYDERNTLPTPTLEELTTKLQELIDAQPLVELRAERNKRLTECDYLAMSDYPHRDYEMKLKWLQYRQALRDLPSSADPQWPVAPSQ